MTRAGSTNPAGGTAAAPDPVGLPRGFGVEFDADTRELSDGSLFGGSPARVLRLTPAGAAALGELRAGPVRSAAASALARRLTDAGLAHPVPPRHATTPGLADTGQTATSDVTVLIPVRDRAVMLDRCLSAASSRQPVVVADDGSADPAAIEVVAARHHARVLRRDTSGGPARARNAGLAEVATDIVAFLDSDCVPPPGWTDELVRHFADPLVGAVAPRIVALASASPAGPACSASPRSAAARYAAVCSSLDLGDRPALVRPGSRVSYAPTAALVVRRSALDSLGAGPDVFDPALRYGEDVDLVWRLVSGGWRIRYDPAVCVPHEGPDTWAGLLERRFRYGTSAAPLARRHPDSMAPLVLHPWPAIAVAAVLRRQASTGGGFDSGGLARHHRHSPPGRGSGRRRAGGGADRGAADLAGHRPLRHSVRDTGTGTSPGATWRHVARPPAAPEGRCRLPSAWPGAERLCPAAARARSSSVRSRPHRRRRQLRSGRLGKLPARGDGAPGPAGDLPAARAHHQAGQ